MFKNRGMFMGAVCVALMEFFHRFLQILNSCQYFACCISQYVCDEYTAQHLLYWVNVKFANEKLLHCVVVGKIAIARYGEMFRGLKVKEAQEHGMIGAVLYSDPGDDGVSRGTVYPDGMWRNPGGVQMGSAWFLNLFAGDALTPFVRSLCKLSFLVYRAGKPS